MTVLVWHDGRIDPVDRPIARADDHGLLMADGVFESLAVRDGRPRWLDRHLRRHRVGLDRLSITSTTSDDELRGAIDELLAASGLSDARLRITTTAGPGPSPRQRGDRPTTFVTIAPLGPSPSSTTVTMVPWVRNERSPVAGIKSLEWSVNAFALRTAADAGFDNALFCDSTGRLSECATANLFLVLDDDIVTPPLTTGCLAGVVREVLVECGAATERELWPADLHEAAGAFLTASTTGVVPVAAVDERVYPIDLAAFARARAALDAATD